MHVLSQSFASYKVTARFPRQIWLSFYFFTDNGGKQLFAFPEISGIILLISRTKYEKHPEGTSSQKAGFFIYFLFIYLFIFLTYSWNISVFGHWKSNQAIKINKQLNLIFLSSTRLNYVQKYIEILNHAHLYVWTKWFHTFFSPIYLQWP